VELDADAQFVEFLVWSLVFGVCLFVFFCLQISMNVESRSRERLSSQLSKEQKLSYMDLHQEKLGGIEKSVSGFVKQLLLGADEALLSNIRICVLTEPIEWMDAFFAANGPAIILSQISSLEKQSASHDIEKQTHLLSFLKIIVAMLLSRRGRQILLVEMKDTLQRLILCLDPKSSGPLSRQLLYSRLALLCCSEPMFYVGVAAAMKYYQFAKREVLQFYDLICAFRDEPSDSTKASCLQFINILVSTPDDLDERIKMRHCFTSLGLIGFIRSSSDAQVLGSADYALEVDIFFKDMEEDEKYLAALLPEIAMSFCPTVAIETTDDKLSVKISLAQKGASFWDFLGSDLDSHTSMMINFGEVEIEVGAVSVLTEKRTRGVEIFLRSCRLTNEAIFYVIASMDFSIIMPEWISLLNNVLPSSTESEAVMQKRSSRKKLTLVERFFCAVIDVGLMQTRVRALDSFFALPVILSDVRSKCDIVRSAISQMRKSDQRWKEILKALMSVSCAMDGSERFKETFRLSSILRTCEVASFSSSRSSRSMIHFVVQAVRKVCPDVLFVSNDLSSVFGASKICFAAVVNDAASARNLLEETCNLIQEVPKSYAFDKFHEVFSEKWISDNREKVDQVVQNVKLCETEWIDLAYWYGEAPNALGVDQFFVEVAAFLGQLTSAYYQLLEHNIQKSCEFDANESTNIDPHAKEIMLKMAQGKFAETRRGLRKLKREGAEK
jgi:hypothetical protein